MSDSNLGDINLVLDISTTTTIHHQLVGLSTLSQEGQVQKNCWEARDVNRVYWVVAEADVGLGWSDQLLHWQPQFKMAEVDGIGNSGKIFGMV